MDNELYAEIDRLKRENERLSDRAVMMESSWRNSSNACLTMQDQNKQLQVRMAQLEEALRRLSCLGNGDRPGNSIGNEIAQQALSESPADWLAKHDEKVANTARKELLKQNPEFNGKVSTWQAACGIARAECERLEKKLQEAKQRIKTAYDEKNPSIIEN